MLLFSRPGECRPRGLGVEIVLKRAYEAAEEEDGFRVLVDRLWPSGKKKQERRLMSARRRLLRVRSRGSGSVMIRSVGSSLVNAYEAEEGPGGEGRD